MQIKLDNLPRSQKINCIKAARWAFADTNGQRLMGLKDAKDAVEAAMLAQPKGDTFSMVGTAVESLASVRQYVNHAQGERGQNGCSLPQVKVSEVHTLNPKDIETVGAQVFNVPNDEEGRAFMASVSKYLNRPQYGMKKRGRGSEGRERHNGRMTYNGQSNCNLGKADWVALYVSGKTSYDASYQVADEKRRGDTLERVAADLRGQVASLESQLAELKGQLDIAVDKAEEYRALAQKYNGQASDLTKQLVDKVTVSQVKRLQPMPPMTLPLANGSKVKIVGATEIKAIA